jgi:biopolymer transport protein ExbB/TolQ
MNPVAAFAHFFQAGGTYMYFILAVGVVILAFVLERFWVIGRAAAVNCDKLTHDIVSKISKGDMTGAADICRRVKNPIATVAHAIVSRGDAADEQKLQNAADGAATVVLPPLSRRLPYLAMLANVSTLMGLMGTIFGLITAFSAVDAADPAQRSAFLAAGISEALNCTAFGLLVAVPTLLAHAFLVSKVERVVENVDFISVRVIDAMTRRPLARDRAA